MLPIQKGKFLDKILFEFRGQSFKNYNDFNEDGEGEIGNNMMLNVSFNESNIKEEEFKEDRASYPNLWSPEKKISIVAGNWDQHRGC